MKILLIALLISAPCFIYPNIMSQRPGVQTIQRKQTDLDKFVGTWIYQENGKTFKIVLNKYVFKPQGETIGMDVIRGSHVYLENDILIDGYPGLNELSIGNGVLNSSENPNILKFRFWEQSSQKRAIGQMEFQQGTPDTLIWTLKEAENFVIITSENDNGERPPFKTPQSLTLHRLQ